MSVDILVAVSPDFDLLDARSLVDIRQLKYFLALTEHRNFAGAAQVLSVSQQAVSKTLRDLEAQLGVKLFERSAHGTTPTEHAKKLEVHARAIFAQIRLAQAELSPGASERGGLVSVGFGASVPERVVTRSINRYRNILPTVAVRIHSQTTRELQRKLIDGNIDLFLSSPPVDFPFAAEVEVAQINVERGQVIVRAEHPLARVGKISLEMLCDSPWIVPSVLEAGWTKVCEVFERQALTPPEDVVQLDSIVVARDLMQSDDYIVLADRHLYESELEKGDVVALDIADLELMRPVVIGLSRTRLQPETITEMVACLKYGAEVYNDSLGGR